MALSEFWVFFLTVVISIVILLIFAVLVLWMFGELTCCSRVEEERSDRYVLHEDIATYQSSSIHKTKSQIETVKLQEV